MNQAIRKGLSLMKTLSVIGIILFMIGSTGSYENGDITSLNYIIKMVLSFAMLLIV